jgi:hypothetical protein
MARKGNSAPPRKDDGKRGKSPPKPARRKAQPAHASARVAAPQSSGPQKQKRLPTKRAALALTAESKRTAAVSLIDRKAKPLPPRARVVMRDATPIPESIVRDFSPPSKPTTPIRAVEEPSKPQSPPAMQVLTTTIAAQTAVTRMMMANPVAQLMFKQQVTAFNWWLSFAQGNPFIKPPGQ